MAPLTITAILIVVCCGTFADGAYCDFNKIPFPGLKRDTTRLYLDGESFTPQCLTGYVATKPGAKLTCNGGVWNGHFPPCVVANCLGAPPSISNGKAVNFTREHLSKVTYACDAFHFLTKESSVQCIQGEWKGSPPFCKDGRCRFTDLKKKEGLISTKNNITLSGDKLEFECSRGYIPIGITPLCAKGAWVEFGTSPCKPMDCVVGDIHHGSLNEAEDRQTWKWSNMRRESKTVFKKVKKGASKPSGEKLQLVCKPKYSFEGKGLNNVTVTCEKGQWVPTPVCLSNRKRK